MATHRYCDSIRRRDFLTIGALTGLGLSLPGYLQKAQAGEVAPSAARSAIFINLAGGASHMDTFDLKPEASDELRGEFRPIKTKIEGLEICEHLPKLAACADKFALLRGVSHSLAAHELGSQYMNTGNRPLPSLEFPGFGAVVSKELPGPGDLPPFVAVPRTPQKAGYLGVQYGPLQTNSTPQPGKPFVVRGLALTKGLTLSDVEKRQQLLQQLDRALPSDKQQDQLLAGLDNFSIQAHDMISSSRTRDAFDISRENAAVASRFGQQNFGQSCLLAARLVEAGVRFVSVDLGGWDTHANNFKTLKETRLPHLDEGLSALLQTLDERGLLASTAVMVTGEFGRTPKINKNAGRDHYPRAMCVLLAGGGMRGGQVIGASDAGGGAPAAEPITPDQIAASFYRALGIDFRKEYHTPTGRPVTLIREGEPLKQLFG